MTVALTQLAIGFELIPSLVMSRCARRFISTHVSVMQINTIIHSSCEGEPEWHKSGCTARRAVIESGMGVLFFSSPVASAANLPNNLGADLTKTGTLETLIPIVTIERSLVNAKLQLTQSTNGLASPEICTNILHSILASVPREKDSFNRIFDSYSTPVSYKQKFLDQNAFLVYYTKGFDGPGRPSIEIGDARENLQTLQYGARNDVWTAMEDLFVELEFGKSGGDGTSTAELGNLIDVTLSLLNSYLRLAPIADVEEVRSQLGQ